jgi:molybdopterin molybdotransferase
MISVKEAREIILSKMNPLPPQKTYLEDALGRYLSSDIISDRDIPPWDNSAMDGYAVQCDGISSQGTKLSVAYETPAGSYPKAPFGKNEAVKIMTGAPLPPGADAVVKREDTLELEGEVIIEKVPKRHQHIRCRGEDIQKGDTILSRGTLIGPAQIGILASIRRILVPCHQRPVVAILATGDEIADFDEELTHEKISSSNSYTLISLVRSIGAIPLYLGIARDKREDLIEKLSMAKKADLILTSGGVSMGDYDMVREIMGLNKNTVDFWKVEMKPGRPLAFGSIDSIPLLGLPGYPVSTMTSFYQFARPAILKLMGANNLLLPTVRARITTPVESKGDRPNYIRGLIERQGDELIVNPTGPQGSGILSSMARGNCFMVVPKGTTYLKKGDLIDCQVFSASW